MIIGIAFPASQGSATLDTDSMSTETTTAICIVCTLEVGPLMEAYCNACGNLYHLPLALPVGAGLFVLAFAVAH